MARYRPPGAIVGYCPYLFVVMGLSGELSQKVTSDVLRAQLDNLLPPNCEILPYDHILRRFESSIPQGVTVLVPAVPVREKISRLWVDVIPGDELRAVYDGRVPRDQAEEIVRRINASGDIYPPLTGTESIDNNL